MKKILLGSMLSVFCLDCDDLVAMQQPLGVVGASVRMLQEHAAELREKGDRLAHEADQRMIEAMVLHEAERLSLVSENEQLRTSVGKLAELLEKATAFSSSVAPVRLQLQLSEPQDSDFHAPLSQQQDLADAECWRLRQQNKALWRDLKEERETAMRALTCKTVENARLRRNLVEERESANQRIQELVRSISGGW